MKGIRAGIKSKYFTKFYKNLSHLGCIADIDFAHSNATNKSEKKPKEFHLIVNLYLKCYRHEERVRKLLLLKYSNCFNKIRPPLLNVNSRLRIMLHKE